MEGAGSESPHLQKEEQRQAAQHAALPALVIHEVVREEGERELDKRTVAVAWSGLAAGLSMGFSFLCLSVLTATLPDTRTSHLVASFGYTVGFVITILGRQELFTESTLTAMLPWLVKRDRATGARLLRFWVVVLTANLVGTALFALLLTRDALFGSSVQAAFAHVAHGSIEHDFVTTLLRAVLSGWLIALMPWLLPSARSSRFFVILLLTYVVAVCELPHVVAGSVEAAWLVFTGRASAAEYAIGFFLPTFIGNGIGGVLLVALLNHVPLSQELHGDAAGKATPRAATPRQQRQRPR